MNHCFMLAIALWTNVTLMKPYCKVLPKNTSMSQNICNEIWHVHKNASLFLNRDQIDRLTGWNKYKYIQNYIAAGKTTSTLINSIHTWGIPSTGNSYILYVWIKQRSEFCLEFISNVKSRHGQHHQTQMGFNNRHKDVSFKRI